MDARDADARIAALIIVSASAALEPCIQGNSAGRTRKHVHTKVEGSTKCGVAK